jgi:hypothetical protein
LPLGSDPSRVYHHFMGGLGGQLRVDPSTLRGAASTQADVGASVGNLKSGSAMADAGGGLPGLQTGQACQFAGSMLDSAAGVVHQELTTHADKLSTAADLYHQTDEQLGQRLRKFSQ